MQTGKRDIDRAFKTVSPCYHDSGKCPYICICWALLVACCKRSGRETKSPGLLRGKFLGCRRSIVGAMMIGRLVRGAK
jgi:hypothetical protein